MLYFAYGSLLDPAQMEGLCPDARRVGAGRIPHHALCFTGKSERWGGGTATIGLAPNRDLWGALYEIDDACRATVERSGAADGYVWSFTSIEGPDGERLDAGVLCKVRDLERHPPSDRYLAVLESGWEEWGLDGARIMLDVTSIL
jgi:hypothetical protein